LIKKDDLAFIDLNFEKVGFYALGRCNREVADEFRKDSFCSIDGFFADV